MSVGTISAINPDIGGPMRGMEYRTMPQVAERMCGRWEATEEPAAAPVWR